jgi:hypothetical protein
VSRAANTLISLDFESTDNPTNSNDGVTERHTPANASGDEAVNAVSAGPAVPAEHPIIAHSSVISDTQRIITLPPG